jgi:two-component system, sensor histidine kinase and response regulator
MRWRLFTKSSHPVNVQILKYGLAVLAVVVATVVTWQLPPIRDRSPFLLFILAVLFSTWYGCRGPGLLSVFLSLASTDYFFLTPAHTFTLSLQELGELTRLGLFGGVAGVVFLMTDRLKQAEAHLRETNAQLEQRVRERTEKLEAATQKLRELDELKSASVSIASHEVRTPLCAIKGYVDNLLAGFVSELNDQVVYYLKRIDYNVNRLIRMTNDLLDLSQIEANRLTLDLQALSIQEVLDQVLETFQREAQEKSVTIMTQVPPALHVRADRHKLERILTNLLDNAIKFTPPGGRVRIESHPVNERTVELTVSDTGCGIAPDAIAKVFEKFHRETSDHRGVGLGLAITKSLVELHGGDISVDSRVGHGTTFAFTLPALEQGS